MRTQIGLICAMLLLPGCFLRKPPPNNPPPSPPKQAPQKTYITPELGPVGRVEMVNTQGRFVVLSFPQGHVPPVGQRWRISHNGLKIGRVTIAGPQNGINTVADMVEGEANVGDQAAPE